MASVVRRLFGKTGGIDAIPVPDLQPSMYHCYCMVAWDHQQVYADGKVVFHVGVNDRSVFLPAFYHARRVVLRYCNRSRLLEDVDVKVMRVEERGDGHFSAMVRITATCNDALRDHTALCNHARVLTQRENRAMRHTESMNAY